MSKKYVIGLDYGTDSVRSVIVGTDNGETAAHRFLNIQDGRRDIL
jgi:ribulose kinase